MKIRNISLLALLLLAFLFALPAAAQDATPTAEGGVIVDIVTALPDDGVGVPVEVTPDAPVVVVVNPEPVEEPTESPRWWDNPLVIQSAITFLALVVVIFTQQSTIRTHIVNAGANANPLLYGIGKDVVGKIVDEIDRRAKLTPSPDDDVEAARIRRDTDLILAEIERRRSGDAGTSISETYSRNSFREPVG